MAAELGFGPLRYEHGAMRQQSEMMQDGLDEENGEQAARQ
jgi:hypothetical protein